VENPTGSIKDRMAQTVILAGRSGWPAFRPGYTVIEYTGGSTGTSLALVCAAKGYRLRIVTSDAQEKRDHMMALGAELTLVPSESGLTTKKLILDMVEAAELSQDPAPSGPISCTTRTASRATTPLGEEKSLITQEKVDAFVHCAGPPPPPAGSPPYSNGTNPKIKIVVVEPAESSVLREVGQDHTRSKASGLATLPTVGAGARGRGSPGQDR